MQAFPADVVPPEGVYPTRQAAIEAANAWAKPRGYALTTMRPKSSPIGLVTVVLACDRYGRPAGPSATCRRETATVHGAPIARSLFCLGANSREEGVG